MTFTGHMPGITTYDAYGTNYNMSHIPGDGMVRENMGTATRSMLPTQMTIMPRNQLSLSINKGLV